MRGLSPLVQYLMALGVSLNLTVLLHATRMKLDGYIADIVDEGILYHTEAITLFSPTSLCLNS
jgi:hypothetical protein